MPFKDKDRNRAYQAARLARRRADWFNDNGPCKGCGSLENLELHHINPNEKVEHRIWSWSWERIEKETKKCQVLCVDCHMLETRLQKARAAKHGTQTMYKGYGCRCEECRSENRERLRRQRDGARQNSFSERILIRKKPCDPIDPVALVISKSSVSSKSERALDKREKLESYQHGVPNYEL